MADRSSSLRSVFAAIVVGVLASLTLHQVGHAAFIRGDANQDLSFDISDARFTLDFLFQGGPEPASPGPRECGPDPTPDDLPLCRYEC